jgi:hypothetical protein
MSQDHKSEKIQTLRRRLAAMQTSGRRQGEPRPLGLPAGALTEIVSSEGGGGLTLGLAIAVVARELVRR